MAGWGMVGLGGALLAVRHPPPRQPARAGGRLRARRASPTAPCSTSRRWSPTAASSRSTATWSSRRAGCRSTSPTRSATSRSRSPPGPALVRMISRFRTAPRVQLAGGAGGAASPSSSPSARARRRSSAPIAPAAGASADRAGCATTRAPTAATPRRPGQPSSPAMTGWAMLGLEAARHQSARPSLGRRDAGLLPARRRPTGCARSATSSGRSWPSWARASTRARSPARTSSPTCATRRDGDGSVDGQVNLTAFYAARDARRGRRPGLAASARRSGCARAQNSDGGWGIQPEAPSESDSTGAALQGLVAAGARAAAADDGAALAAHAPSRAAAAGRSARAASSTRSRPPGRSRVSSPPARARTQIDRGLGYLSRLRSGRRPLLATRPPATRRRSGSPAGHARDRAQGVPARRGRAQLRRSGSAADSGSSDGSPATGSSDEAATGSAGGTSAGAGAPASSAGGSGGGSAAGDGDAGGGAAAGGADPGAGVQTAAGDAGQTAGADPGADAPAPAAGDEATAPVSVSYASESPPDDDTTAYLLGGLAVLAAIVAGGYLWYRRRLP